MPPSVRHPLARPTLVQRPGPPTKEDVQEQIAAAKLRLSQTATSAATKSAETASDMERLLRNQVEILRRLGAMESMLSKLTRSQPEPEAVEDVPSDVVEAEPSEETEATSEDPVEAPEAVDEIAAG